MNIYKDHKDRPYVHDEYNRKVYLKSEDRAKAVNDGTREVAPLGNIEIEFEGGEKEVKHPDGRPWSTPEKIRIGSGTFNMPLGTGKLTAPKHNDEYSAILEAVTFAKHIPSDPVNHPSHYKAYPLENLETIRGSMSPIEYQGFLKGTALKYLYRYRLKDNPMQDLKKSRFFLDELMKTPLIMDTYKENRIAELEEENRKLVAVIIERDNTIKELETKHNSTAYECCQCGVIFDVPDTVTCEILCPICGAGAKEVGDIIEGELHEQSKL